MSDITVPFELFEDHGPTDADMVSGSFDPARLTQARCAAGLSKAALAQQVGVSAAAIGQFEAQVSRPRAEHIPALAKALHVPVSYFATGRPLGRLDGSEAHFRSLRSTTAKERAKAVAFIERVWELTFALERYVDFPVVDLPRLQGSERTPIAAAQRLREHWGLGVKPIKHLVAQAESHGVVVCALALSNADVARVDAFSTSHLERPIIVVTPERARSVHVQRFTIAHELGHLLMHGDAAPGDPQQEREADQFAAEFLTPRSQIFNLLPRTVNLARLDELSRHWGVSVDSLLFRMKESGEVSDSSIRRGYQQLASLRASSLAVSDPVAAYPGEIPRMLNQAGVLYESSGRDIDELATELHWHPALVHSILGRENPRPRLRLLPPE